MYCLCNTQKMHVETKYITYFFVKFNLKIAIKNFILLFGCLLFFFEGRNINLAINVHVAWNMATFCMKIYRSLLSDTDCLMVLEAIKKFNISFSFMLTSDMRHFVLLFTD